MLNEKHQWPLRGRRYQRKTLTFSMELTPWIYTAAFTYYYDPEILQNKLTPLSIFRDLALRKGDSKKFMFYLYVFYRVYTNIPKLFGLVVYPFMDFLGDYLACARFGTNI